METSKGKAAAMIPVQSDAVNRVLSQSSSLALVQTGTEFVTDGLSFSQMVLSLHVGGKLLNFNRKSSDLISQVITRMKISCGKALKETIKLPDESIRPSKLQKGDKSPFEELEIAFLDSDCSALTEGTLKDVMNNAMTLRIDETIYKIIKDPPMASHLEVESHLYIGFPVVASWSCSGAPENEFSFEWRILDPKHQDLVDTVHSGETFVPLRHHDGCYLEVRCFHPSYPDLHLSFAHPDRIGEFQGTQKARLPEPLPETDAGVMRVSTFNILAQPYLRTPLAQDVYYTHIHKCWGITDWSRRLPLVLREMLDTNSDIYCLQEVAGGAHEIQLKRALASTHDWHFFGKASLANNGNPIGVSISLRKDKFVVISEHRVNLGKGEDSLFQSMLSESEREHISANFGEKFFGPVLNGLHTCAGIVHAKTIGDSRDVLIANTHLFFHPFGGHLRILQGVCLMRKLAEMRDALTVRGKPLPAIIVCGDFNSRPDSGSFKIMRSGAIEADHIDWQYGKSFRYECYGQNTSSSDPPVSSEEDEAATATIPSTAELPPVKGIDLKHPLQIQHVPSTIPELTHATASFRSTLDYIFFSGDSIEAVEGVGTGSSLPHLTHAEVDRMGGLPFDYYGSDHVLVCGDVRFK
jgi:2',5'-phosphodiesterase